MRLVVDDSGSVEARAILLWPQRATHCQNVPDRQRDHRKPLMETLSKIRTEDVSGNDAKGQPSSLRRVPSRAGASPRRTPAPPSATCLPYLLYQNAMREQFKRENPGMTFVRCLLCWNASCCFGSTNCLTFVVVGPACQIHLSHVQESHSRREVCLKCKGEGRQGAVRPRNGELCPASWA